MLFSRLLKATVCVAFFYGICAWANQPGAESRPVFPGTSIVLEDGDVILNDGLGIVSSFNRRFGYPAGPYSHATVFIERPNVGWRVVGYDDEGIKVSKPQLVLERNYRLALLRPVVKPPSGALVLAYQELKRRPLKFDYDMAWPTVDSNQTYCVGFISQLFRLAEPSASDWFPQPQKRPNDFWSDWAMQKLGLDISRIASPNSLLTNPHFRLLAEYVVEDDKMLLVEKWVRDTVLEKVEEFLRDDRLDIAPPKPGSRLTLSVAATGMIDGIAFARMPVVRQEKFISVYEFMVRVEERVNRTIRLNEEHAWDEDAVKSLTNSVANAFRDEFFVSPSAR